MKKISFIILLLLALTSCQSIKDGLSGKKGENSDEFLVQKKNPLVLPPDYSKLPKPNDETLENEAALIEEETNVEKILNLETSPKKNSPSQNTGSAEDFVLKKINQN
mgnify:CR=1 FL=1|tara:strand:+ start:1268 stop:1588 length:321 start_codon:yes stop_codon:yes gene_type:complete